ncbi:polyamine aminopropyltransferase [Streptomyces diacarni]|uniref:Polyamine aminopropyltransferase n=1 Tax=Streptomyces diacarni TaxID=2800381 RepID=A0A367F023_9ACTN|nr:polyamine aminopropyltransferase [Streptomyces diacarni]RCG23718.1 polyamine aminopropyltransferase [Streptomyces diacarni]
MIDRSPPGARTTASSARLPVAAGLGRGFVLASVFVCAACGLVYELELVAVASSLVGDSVTQASVVLSVMVFAMGVGSLLAKRLPCHAAAGFGYVEALLALAGGGSAMALYACFSWLGEARIALVAISFTIGVLIGAEMPLLMTLIQRIRQQDAGGALADLFAADYVGALVGGLTFPFLLLPLFGQLTGALLTGVVNVLAGGLVVQWLFRHDLPTRVRWRLLGANGCVLALLLCGTAFVAPFERAARQAVYGGDVRVAVRSGEQELVLTGGATRAAWPDAGELRLFRDGRLAVRGPRARERHEALAGPAMESGPHGRVLVLGGGDGLSAREVLHHTGVERVTVVEPDSALVRLARRDPGLLALNDGALDDPRVRVVTVDAFDWLRDRAASGRLPYDVIVAALPAPSDAATSKLYSQEFYGLAARALSAEGRLAVRAGSPDADPHAFWTVDATLRAAGLTTCPYAREAEDRGYLLARRAGGPSGPASEAVPRRCGPPGGRFTAGARLAERADGEELPPSTLMHPRYPG